MEWKTVGDLSAINVNISPRGDSTSIQIVGDRGPAAGVTFIFPMMASAILVGALGATFEPTSAAGIISLVARDPGSGVPDGQDHLGFRDKEVPETPHPPDGRRLWVRGTGGPAPGSRTKRRAEQPRPTGPMSAVAQRR